MFILRSILKNFCYKDITLHGFHFLPTHIIVWYTVIKKSIVIFGWNFLFSSQQKWVSMDRATAKIIWSIQFKSTKRCPGRNSFTIKTFEELIRFIPGYF